MWVRRIVFLRNLNSIELKILKIFKSKLGRLFSKLKLLVNYKLKIEFDWIFWRKLFCHKTWKLWVPIMGLNFFVLFMWFLATKWDESKSDRIHDLKRFNTQCQGFIARGNPYRCLLTRKTSWNSWWLSWTNANIVTTLERS